VSGAAPNTLDDVFELTFRYDGLLADDGPDHCGDGVFAMLPAFVNRDLTVVVRGRDTAPNSGEFEQYMFFATMDPDSVGDRDLVKKNLINAYPVSLYGRYTAEQEFTFHFKMHRPAGPAGASTPPCEAAP
jgi:hypothetical protein